MSNEEQAKLANDRFYEAFNKQSLDLMKEVWESEGTVSCIHPGWPVIHGYDPTIKSWEDIFKNTDNLEIKLSDIEIVANANLAWVSCQENLFSISMSGVQTTKVHATNVYKKTNDFWKIILHHASPLPGAGG